MKGLKPNVADAIGSPSGSAGPRFKPRRRRPTGAGSQNTPRRSERRALAHGCRPRAVVEIVEFAAHWHAVREARHLDGIVGQEIDDVVRGRLAFDGGVDGKDHFADAALGDAPDQAREIEIGWTDAIERRESAAKHMVARPRSPRPLQSPKIADG